VYLKAFPLAYTAGFNPTTSRVVCGPAVQRHHPEMWMSFLDTDSISLQSFCCCDVMMLHYCTDSSKTPTYSRHSLFSSSPLGCLRTFSHVMCFLMRWTSSGRSRAAFVKAQGGVSSSHYRTDFNLRGAIYIRDGMTSASLVLGASCAGRSIRETLRPPHTVNRIRDAATPRSGVTRACM
jgi:hypothetical protein